jgi:hypothetical protein
LLDLSHAAISRRVTAADSYAGRRGRPDRRGLRVDQLGQEGDRREHIAKGAKLLAIDNEFGALPDEALFLSAVNSDLPIRKYFLFTHQDGSFSSDHFPNTR